VSAARGANEPVVYDAVVIGAGPAGQKAAIQFAKAGRRTLMIERGQGVGGECVHRGTIPSKTLRETAVYLSGLRSRSDGVIGQEIRPDLEVESLMRRQVAVRHAHERFIGEQLERNDITLWRARARFLSSHEIEATGVDGTRRAVQAETIVIATGSRPRTPPDVPVDHESILDSDSILSLIYLPSTLTVLGGGVIACEFATIFTALGVQVTIIDKADRPLAFLDPEITSVFVADFERRGGRYMGRRKIERVESDGVIVVTTMAGGETVRTQKLLCALGREAQVNGLGLDAAGLAVTARGLIEVDEFYRSATPHVYAVGDVIGPPSLAATSMEQGRCAARHALGLAMDGRADVTPVGIYTIPEMASVGLTESDANARGPAFAGRARFDELARGQISGSVQGLLKLVADAEGRLLGAHIVGEGATELIHVAQMALIAELPTSAFIENVFNFPTFAEAYRVAAIDIEGQMGARAKQAA
jgi:NAD(P) transhydrogenase